MNEPMWTVELSLQLEAAIQGSVRSVRVAATKLLEIRMQDYSMRATIALARFAVGSNTTGKDLRIIIDEVIKRTWEESKGQTAITMLRFDGEAINVTLKAGKTRGTTPSQITDRAFCAVRDQMHKWRAEENIMPNKRTFSQHEVACLATRISKNYSAVLPARPLTKHFHGICQPAAMPDKRGGEAANKQAKGMEPPDAPHDLSELSERHTEYMIEELARDAAQRCNTNATRPSGLKWTNVGSTKPAVGRELSNSALASALQKKRTISKKAWGTFGITDLSIDDFIQSGESYYKPAAKPKLPGPQDALPDYTTAWNVLQEQDPKWRGLVAPSQVWRAYRMHIAAAHCRTMEDLKVMVDELQQATYESVIFELKQAGVDFEKFVYVPEINEITGKPLLCVEDNPHKLKNLGTAIKRQAPDADPSALAISKKRCLEAVDKSPELVIMKPFLHGKTNPQNVASHENFFFSPLLRQKLIEQGDWRSALWLKAFADKYQAWDTSHLTHDERNVREGVLYRLIAAALHSDIHNTTVKHSAPAAYMLGFPRKLLMVLMENIDARRHVLDLYHDGAQFLVERALSTDDIETLFSMIVYRCGYKPELEQLIGVLANIDRLAAYKRDPMLGFILNVSTKTNVTQYTAMTKRMSEWNDGAFLKSDSDPIKVADWLWETPEFHAYRKAIQKKVRPNICYSCRLAIVMTVTVAIVVAVIVAVIAVIHAILQTAPLNVDCVACAHSCACACTCCMHAYMCKHTCAG